ncbi:MAG: PKD domain-containing protein [Candidatus Cloacimonetes bacterium]|nr:PKD domain-containing protein [Candidatus Cloacimonadota bacterium]
MIDFKLTSGTSLISDYLIKITGPGGEAIIPMDESIEEAYYKWKTFSFLISETVWTVNSGSWNAILNNIEEVRLITEFISGTEVVQMDNIKISNELPVASFTNDKVYICPSGEIQFQDTSLYAPFEWFWDFGDGNTSMDKNPLHTYENSGFYDVQLSVTNYFGSDVVIVENLIEVQNLSGPILFYDDFNDDDIHPAWSFINGTWSETSGEMRQTSNDSGTGWLNGCFALAGCSAFSDYEVSVDFMSTDNDGIGAIFNYQDASNFYLFVWRAQTNYRGILKYENGVETELASDATAYTSGTWYNLIITDIAGNISCSIDNTEIFNVSDNTFVMGKAGLYCWANQNSYWDNFSITNAVFLDSPQNVTITRNGDEINITWNPAFGATSYKVYSSNDPYSGFLEDITGTFTDESWSAPATVEKKFYYVKAVN